MKYKIIFLDIDGVLNVRCEKKDEFGCIFHENFVNNLRWIIKKTDAKIVISSTWKIIGIEKLREMWKKRNLPGEIIDITPYEVDVVEKSDIEFYDFVDRGHEIQQWLDDNNEIVKNYCIIDDENDMLPSQQNNFVRTSNNMNHPDSVNGYGLNNGYGLTKICSKKVIRILNS